MNAHRVKPSVFQVLYVTDNAALSGSVELDVDAYTESVSPAFEVDLELLRSVLELGVQKARDGELDKVTTLDQWLSPRVHFALRIPRRLAADSGFWTWLTLEVGRPYTWFRWADTDKPTMYRYTGDFKRNALARLWWFAEMSRNGSDYSPIKDVLRDASTAQYAMELRYSMYRPAVIAFGAVARANDLSFDRLKDLSKRINAYLSLRVLEVMGLDANESTTDVDWWNDTPGPGEVLTDGDLVGPRDSFASDDSIATLVEWFEALIAERSDLKIA